MYLRKKTGGFCSWLNGRRGTVSFLLAATLFFAVTPAGHCNEEKATLLRQRSRLVGEVEILVTKKGVRLTIPTRQLVMILMPPEWKVQFLNTARKIYCQCPSATWTLPSVRMASYFRPGDPSSLKVIRSEPSTLDGLACRKYQMKVPAAVNSDGRHAWQQLLIREGVLYTLTDPPLPAAATSAIARTVGSVNAVAGVPLQLNCTSNRDKSEDEIKLDGHSQVKVKPTDLQVPKDFKLVNNAMEVSASASNEDVADLIH